MSAVLQRGFRSLTQGSFSTAPVPPSPSRTLDLSRTVVFHNYNGFGNMKRWYDYSDLIQRYPVGTFFYFYRRGEVYRCRFRAELVDGWHAIDVSIAEARVGWNAGTALFLSKAPTYEGAFPAPASAQMRVTVIEDRPALTGCTSVAMSASDVGAAYSLRALQRGFTGAVARVRRSSDNVEADLFANPAGVLLQTSGGQDVEAWLAAGATPGVPSPRGYVTRWYDQSGNGNHAVMAVAARQPELVYEATSQRFCIYFPGLVSGGGAGFALTAPVDTCGVSVAFRPQPTASGWTTLVAVNNDNFGLRTAGNTFLNGGAAWTEFTSQEAQTVASLNGFASARGAPVYFEFGAWNHLVATRSVTTPMQMTLVGYPFSAGLQDRAFLGHMFELLLFRREPSVSDLDVIFENRPIAVGASPELFEYPPAAIAHAPLYLPPGSVNEVTVGMVGASATDASTPAHNAFDFATGSVWRSLWGTYAATTGAHTGVASVSTSAGTRAGEFLVLTQSRPRVLTAFDLLLGDGAGWVLRRYCIVGSNDGTAWTMVSDQTSANVDLASETWHRVSVTNAAAFSRYMFVFSQLSGNVNQRITVTELRPVFADTAYDCTASSSSGAGPPILAFDGEATNARSWTSATGRYTVTVGTYAGAVATAATHPTTGSTVNAAGEWLQLRSVHPIAVNGVRVNAGWSIRKYSVAGSDDGSSWTLVHAQDTNVDLAVDANVDHVWTPLTGGRRFRFHRFIVRELVNNGSSSAAVTSLQLVSGGWRKDLADTVTGAGGATLAKYKSIVSEGAYGLGEYAAYANTVWDYVGAGAYSRDEWPPSGLFDKVDGTSLGRSGWHSAFHLPSTVDVATPAWAVLKLPRAVTVRQYVLTVRNQAFGHVQMPSRWELQGSHDGAAWTTLDAQTGASWAMAGESRRFAIPANATAFAFYRLVALRTVGGEWLSIGELRLYALEGPRRLVEYPPAGVPAGNAWSKDLGDTLVGLGGAVLARYKTTVASADYGAGEYVAYANNVNGYTHTSTYGFGEWPASGAFDRLPGVWAGGARGWASAVQLQLNSDAGANAPWLALRTPLPIAVREYTIETRGEPSYTANESPRAWQFQGSSDAGSNWTTLDERSNVTWHGGAREQKRFAVAAARASNVGAFRDHRVVFQRVQVDANVVNVGELRLHAVL
jgi:hypothetical protein